MGSSVRVVLSVVGGCCALLGLLAFAVLRTGGPVGPPETALPVAPAPSTAVGPAARVVDQGPSRSGVRSPVDPVWVARTAAEAGIPVPAMRAYAAAELVLRREQPACRLSWNTLAGIGWVESQHGTVGGRSLGADGRSSAPILGPALDGAGGFAAIRSTPSSAAWHGDARWEHAVGPLQFLASTWSRWGADGDGDGTADPNDLDDAALAAGRYLCADGHVLTADAGWSAAVHAYNHDDGYVARVAAAANSYAAQVGTAP